MLTIHDVIHKTNFNIDNFLIDKFWNNMADDIDIYIDDNIIKWMGYAGNSRISKQKFIKLLNHFTENADYSIFNNKEYEKFLCTLKDTQKNI